MSTNLEKILLIDQSGRGHALAEAFVRTNSDCLVLYAPGCTAIDHPRIQSLPQLNLGDPRNAARFAANSQVSLAFVANPSALARGFVDCLESEQIPVVGPDKSASMLETSKSFTKRLCEKFEIPTAGFAVAYSATEAMTKARSFGGSVVIKADGPARGNGSFICHTSDQIAVAINRLMIQREFGTSGDQVVIEEFLTGWEFSWFAMLDGQHWLRLPTAMDYTFCENRDAGVPCAGVGALSPHPKETAEVMLETEQKIVAPLMRCLLKEKLRYLGPIYLGCIYTAQGVKLLEINARLGDPEAQAILPRINSDILAISRAVLNGTLCSFPLQVIDELHTCVVVAFQGPTKTKGVGHQLPGWPYGEYARGLPVTGCEEIDPSICRLYFGEVSHTQEDGIRTDGGRIIHIVGEGGSYAQARERAYANIQQISFDGMRYRSDIGL